MLFCLLLFGGAGDGDILEFWVAMRRLCLFLRICAYVHASATPIWASRPGVSIFWNCFFRLESATFTSSAVHHVEVHFGARRRVDFKCCRVVFSMCVL